MIHRSRIRPQVHEVRWREFVVVVATRRLLPHCHQVVGVQERNGPKEHMLHQCVDRGVRADAKCNREHRDRRESRHLGQGTERVPEILQEGVHSVLLWRRTWSSRPVDDGIAIHRQ
jgi:hypothetical protein